MISRSYSFVFIIVSQTTTTSALLSPSEITGSPPRLSLTRKIIIIIEYMIVL